jgi:hypothetical protein
MQTQPLSQNQQWKVWMTSLVYRGPVFCHRVIWYYSPYVSDGDGSVEVSGNCQPGTHGMHCRRWLPIAWQLFSAAALLLAWCRFRHYQACQAVQPRGTAVGLVMHTACTTCLAIHYLYSVRHVLLKVGCARSPHAASSTAAGDALSGVLLQWLACGDTRLQWHLLLSRLGLAWELGIC